MDEIDKKILELLRQEKTIDELEKDLEGTKGYDKCFDSVVIRLKKLKKNGKINCKKVNKKIVWFVITV